MAISLVWDAIISHPNCCNTSSTGLPASPLAPQHLFSTQQPNSSFWNVSCIISLLCSTPSNGSSFYSEKRPEFLKMLKGPIYTPYKLLITTLTSSSKCLSSSPNPSVPSNCYFFPLSSTVLAIYSTWKVLSWNIFIQITPPSLLRLCLNFTSSRKCASLPLFYTAIGPCFAKSILFLPILSFPFSFIFLAHSTYYFFAYFIVSYFVYFLSLH